MVRAIPDFWLIDFESFFFLDDDDDDDDVVMYVQVCRSEFSAFGIFLC